MNEVPENPEETESATDEVQEPPDNQVPLEPAQAKIEPSLTRPPWKRIAKVVGGVVMIATGAAIATLAATHKYAVRENAMAYVNGLVDGYAIGFVDGVEAGTRTLFEGNQFDW